LNTADAGASNGCVPIKEYNAMKHLRPISVAKASDSFGYIFFQIWLAAFTTLLTAAFSGGKDK
jgi:hypothetical protein